MLQIAFIIKAFGTPLAQSGFDSTYPWRKTPNNWNGEDDWEIINRMQPLGIYASSECRRDPRTGTFANRFCHSDKDCCYTLEFVKSKRNPCRMECRDAPPGSGGSFLLSPTQTCQFAFSSGYDSQCE